MFGIVLNRIDVICCLIPFLKNKSGANSLKYLRISFLSENLMLLYDVRLMSKEKDANTSFSNLSNVWEV